MKVVKLVAITLGAYLGLVVAFECLVAFMGERQADRGLQPGETWVIITTLASDGSTKDTVVAGVESGGQLYVSANHWPRAWYDRAVEHPDVEVTRASEKSARRAVPVDGPERAQIARDYELPWPIRLLSGFPPRSFLRLDPR